MSHELVSFIQPLAAACPGPLTGLVVGQDYRVDGLNQSSGAGQGLTGFSIIAQAISPTRLSTTVKVIPAFATANDDGWPGQFDYDTCQLIHLTDPFLNDVWSAANISRWPWVQQRAGISSNQVGPGTFVDIGPATLLTVQNNVVSASGNLDINVDEANVSVLRNHIDRSGNIIISGTHTGGAVGINNNQVSDAAIDLQSTASPVAISDNVINLGNIAVNNPAPTGGTGIVISRNTINDSNISKLGNGQLLFISNHLDGFSNILEAIGTTSTGPLEVVRNEFNGTAVLSYAGAQTSWLFNNNVIGPFASVNSPGPAGQLTLNDNNITGLVNLTGQAGDAVIQANTIDGTLVIVNPVGATASLFNTNVDYTSFLNILSAGVASVLGSTLLNSATINLTGPAVIGSAYIENAILNDPGFNADRISLRNATSTLVAPVNDAQKVGYPNALP